MGFIYEKIHVPEKHSFITRKMLLTMNTRIHSHINFELNYINSGTGRRIVGDNISSFGSNDLVLMGPNIPHTWEVFNMDTNEEAFCFVTHFTENIVRSEFFNIPELDKMVKLLENANRGIHFKKNNAEIGEILKIMINQEGLDYYISLLEIFKILLKTEDYEFLSNPISYSNTFSKYPKKINKIYEYVFLNIQEDLKLKDVSMLVNMGPSSFCRYFKKESNTTFMEYVKSVRIGMAAKLLAETDKKITQICFECGYNNHSNFNNYFKKIMGKTPTEYRKDFKKLE